VGLFYLFLHFCTSVDKYLDLLRYDAVYIAVYLQIYTNPGGLVFEKNRNVYKAARYNHYLNNSDTFRFPFPKIKRPPRVEVTSVCHVIDKRHLLLEKYETTFKTKIKIIENTLSKL